MTGISCPILAATERDLDSHAHGSATLNIALDGNSVFLELETPWNNLVGFEHAPSTDEQHELVDNALALLNAPTKLFSFDGGSCSTVETSVESSLEDGHDDDHDAHHDEDHDEKHSDGHGDEHDDHHDEKHGDDHDEHHDEKHEEHHDDDHDKHHDEGHNEDHSSESETHSEVLATYTYTCEKPAALSAIDIKLFNLWSGFEDLDVQVIGPGGQTLAELNAQNTTVDMSQVQ